MNVDASFDVNMLGQIYCWEVIIFYTPSQSLFGKKKRKKRKKNPGYENRFVEIYSLYRLILTVSDETLAWKWSY
jgi:hypothetical protein